MERHSLERFKAIVPDFPAGEIAENEEPDFIVTTENGPLGIELTTLHVEGGPNSLRPQASEAMRWRVVDRAQALYNGADHPPVSCSVHLRDGHIGKSAVGNLAAAIVEIVVRNLPEPGVLAC